MVFYGFHGVHPVEKEMGQRIEVDVELLSDFEAVGRADDLSRALNYVDIYEIVREIVEEKGFNLIEGIGVSIAGRILDQFELEKVTVRVRKPQPPLGGLVDAVEFEVSKDRK
jgi:7,8-dihydroneopterin aldolase/epimerase/oxygenase